MSNSLEHGREVDAHPNKWIRKEWRHRARSAGKEMPKSDLTVPKKDTVTHHEHDDEAQRGAKPESGTSSRKR